MSVEQIKEEIAHCDYYIQRIQQNIMGELLANYGGRTTGHSADNAFLQEYIERKEELNKKLNKLTHQSTSKSKS